MTYHHHSKTAGPTSAVSKRERLLSDAQIIQRAANGVSLPKVTSTEEALKRVDAAARGESAMTRGEQLRRIEAATGETSVTSPPAPAHTITGGQTPTQRDAVVAEALIEAVRKRFRAGCLVGTPLVEVPVNELKVVTSTPEPRVFVDLEVLLGLLR